MARFNLKECSKEQLEALDMFVQQAIGPESDSVMECHLPNGDIAFKTLIPEQSVDPEARAYRMTAIRFLVNRIF